KWAYGSRRDDRDLSGDLVAAIAECDYGLDDIRGLDRVGPQYVSRQNGGTLTHHGRTPTHLVNAKAGSEEAAGEAGNDAIECGHGRATAVASQSPGQCSHAGWPIARSASGDCAAARPASRNRNSLPTVLWGCALSVYVKTTT